MKIESLGKSKQNGVIPSGNQFSYPNRGGFIFVLIDVEIGKFVFDKTLIELPIFHR
jgi:hypothetical protein